MDFYKFEKIYLNGWFCIYIDDKIGHCCDRKNHLHVTTLSLPIATILVIITIATHIIAIAALHHHNTNGKVDHKQFSLPGISLL